MAISRTDWLEVPTKQTTSKIWPKMMVRLRTSIFRSWNSHWKIGRTWKIRMKWTWKMVIEAAISWNFEKDLKMMGLKKWLKWVRGTKKDPKRDGIYGWFFPQSYCNKMGVTPVIIFFLGGIFHYKPSSSGGSPRKPPVSSKTMGGFSMEVLRMGDDSLG